MLKIKNTVTNMNLFDELVSRLNTAEKKKSKLEDISIEPLNTKRLGERRLEKQNRISKDCGTTTKVLTTA